MADSRFLLDRSLLGGNRVTPAAAAGDDREGEDRVVVG
jgi:hypothetical protein